MAVESFRSAYVEIRLLPPLAGLAFRNAMSMKSCQRLADVVTT